MKQNYSELFTPTSLKNRVVPNRLVAQAMEINSASEGGAVNKGVIKRYKELARGRWGIVFLEATSVTGQHLARRNGLILNAANLDGFKHLVEEFKKANDNSLFIIQLTHSGRQSGSFSKKVKIYKDQNKEIPVLTENELDEIQEQFTHAIHLAIEAGFDGVDVKACHGYLGSELLRPLNNRADKYGGSTENRARFISQLIKAATCEDPGFIVGSRVSLFEGIQGGCGTAGADEVMEDLSEMKEILTHLVDAGADFLNISSGIPSLTPQITRPSKKGSFYRYSHFRYAKSIKELFPNVITIGSTYTTGDESGFEFAASNIRKGYTDATGFGRQNLADPLIPLKLAEKPESIQFCTLCGKCSKFLKNDEHVYCGHHHAEDPYS
jgi:2,4-dienoyl-CoA reductase-like NADH-dependent reductase (Old Yellow Enzyme family)